MIDVSLIIVNWNTRELLLGCIQSIYETVHDIRCEIIVVDNASEDGSAEAVIKAYPDVMMIKNTKNMGFAAANNIGIKRSSGRYVCLVNSDIVLLDNCLEMMVAFMEQNKHIGAAGPKTVGADMKFRLNCRKFPSLANSIVDAFALDKFFRNTAFQGRLIRDISETDISYVDVISGCFFILRREVIDQVGLLDEQFFIYGEDKDWCKRIHNAGWKVAFYPRAKAIHFGGASSAAEPVRFNMEQVKSDFQYWRKHHSALGYYSYAIIRCLHYLLRVATSLLGIFFGMNPHPMYLNQRKKCLNWIFLNIFLLRGKRLT